jgi:class 3 adenylate cyclase/pimeloyl-ACP methyl ester carboxylesterase
MVSAPETRYAPDGDLQLAYQVASDAGPDLLLVPTATFPIDLLWDEPAAAHALRRLASFSRLVLCDLIGVGSSDAVPIAEMPAMQAWSDGIAAVLEAAECDRASIFAAAESALPVMLYAASHPERVRQLVLWSPYGHFPRTPEQPWGMPEAVLANYLAAFERMVGTGELVDILAPSRADDLAFRQWWGRGERLSAGRGYFRHVLELFLRTDVRAIVGSIQAPTLVIRRRGDRHVREGHAQALVDQLPDGRLVELPGDDNTWFASDADAVVDEIESFITGARSSAATNRVLSTVLFTDIVGSTEHASAVGDAEWATTLGAHNAAAARQVSAARGHLVKYTGDGVLATFDGPARAIGCAFDIRDAVRELDLEIRCGLHTGEVEVMGEEVLGIAVHIAARIMALAEAGEVLVSGSIPPLVLGSGMAFVDRGSHPLKGVPDPWPVFAVVDSTAPGRSA